MKKTFSPLCIVICLLAFVFQTGCSSSNSNVVNNPLPGGNNTRLSKDGVNYLISNGTLFISGNGVVTRDAITSLSPEFNFVDFESGTLDVGDGAFSGYTNLMDVSFKNNVRNIGAEAFRGTSLAIVVFGESIESIGDKAFADTIINYVLINNRAMFENFNSRYDFGEVALTASNIYVHKDFVPFESGKDYTVYKSIAGKYLSDSGFFERLTGATRGHRSLAKETYEYRNICGESEFLPIRAENHLERVMDNCLSYNPENNYFEYSFSYNLDPWEKLNIVRYDGYINGSVLNTSMIGTKGNSPPAIGSNNNNNINNNNYVPFVDNKGTNNANSGSNCFHCGGSGKKDCTSCDGGYIIEYESGQYLGYGPTTREVRKDCPVCIGGMVTCYH